jgi:hypothetical protein
MSNWSDVESSRRGWILDMPARERVLSEALVDALTGGEGAMRRGEPHRPFTSMHSPSFCSMHRSTSSLSAAVDFTMRFDWGAHKMNRPQHMLSDAA